MRKYILQSLFVIVAFIGFNSCETDEYEIPEIEYATETATITISDLIKNYTNSVIDKNYIIEGVVVGNNNQGALFKAAYITDIKGVEHGSIKLYLEYDIDDFFPMGRHLVIKLKDWYVGEDVNGISLFQRKVDANPSPIGKGEMGAGKRINYKKELIDVEPTVVTMNELGRKWMNAFIKIENVQFVEDDIDKKMTDYNDQFAVPGFVSGSTRYLVECGTGDTVQVRTSTYAVFANQEVPGGKGSVSGILSYYGDVEARDNYRMFITKMKDFKDTMLDDKNTRCGE
ncbi:MAG: hypothetical protein KAG96_04675 [Ichthyobacteriaceae bacterium]|nr:hypothetical protein [Ichthyobacteriaceae bacterium]